MDTDAGLQMRKINTNAPQDVDPLAVMTRPTAPSTADSAASGADCRFKFGAIYGGRVKEAPERGRGRERK